MLLVAFSESTIAALTCACPSKKKTDMKLHFLGANRQVTGSRYCLETRTSRVMVDCGLFQERPYKARNWHPSTIEPDSLDALVLTHAHIDHSGLVPKLIKEGFEGPVIASAATVDLVEIMLRDAAKIQAEDAAYKRKRHKKEARQSRYPDEPLYEIEHVEALLPLLRGESYGSAVHVTEDIQVTFHDAGHILGSAILEFRVTEDERTRTVVFSGDIGQHGKPLIRDPAQLAEADYLVMESTYGDRLHAERGDIESQFATIINETVEARGKVVIPTFAVERAQEIVYHLARLVHAERIPSLPVYLDSPMAVDVTQVFRQHRDCLDEATWDLIASGTPPLQFPGLKMTRSTNDSIAINEVQGPCVIMSTSGMCTAGRIKHHLKRTISDARNTILFVGYQAAGTLGRLILDGRATVRIHGKEQHVKASVRQIYGFSGHADQAGLLSWATNFRQPPRHTYLTHGDEEAALELLSKLQQQSGWEVSVPEYLSMYDLF